MANILYLTPLISTLTTIKRAMAAKLKTHCNVKIMRREIHFCEV